MGDVYDTVSNPAVFEIQPDLSYPGLAGSGNSAKYTTGDQGAIVGQPLGAAASAAMGPAGAGSTYYFAILQDGDGGSLFRDNGPGGSNKKFTLNFGGGGNPDGANAFIEETSNSSEGSHQVCSGCQLPNAPNLFLMRVQNQGFGNDDVIDIVVNPDLSLGEPDWASDGGSVGIQITNRDITSPSNTGYANYQWSPQGGFYNASNTLIDEIRIGTTFNDVIPEPASMVLLGLGGLSLLARRRHS